VVDGWRSALGADVQLAPIDSTTARGLFRSRDAYPQIFSQFTLSDVSVPIAPGEPLIDP
jgi:hypothetical protein